MIMTNLNFREKNFVVFFSLFYFFVSICVGDGVVIILIRVVMSKGNVFGLATVFASFDCTRRRETTGVRPFLSHFLCLFK